jgi:CubicO group peptidase (beta-lactamase class C family)
LVAWNQALHGGELLPDPTYKEMAASGRLANGTTLRYGMGLAVPEDEGHPVIGHLGAIGGFLNASLYYPESDLIIVVLQNTWGPKAGWSLADELVQIALGPGEPPEPRPYEGNLSTFAGRYAGPARGDLMTLQIRAKDGHLLASKVGSEAKPDTLRHISGLKWQGKHNRFQLGREHYRFVRAGDQSVELRLDEVYGHYVLRRVGAP